MTPPDTMPTHRLRVHIAESTLAAIPLDRIAKLPDSVVQSLTRYIARYDTTAKGLRLWKEYFARSQRFVAERNKQYESEHAAELKREAQQRYENIVALASCKPGRARITSLTTNHLDWDDTDIASIACHRVRIGMTADQVRAAWGRPDDINRSVYSFGVHEQWVWEDSDGMPYQYAYMEDGVLTSIQQ
jgi:hypothetical protein